MNENPQAIAFANGRIRPMADMLYSVYLTAQSLVEQWNTQNVAAVIPPGDQTVIDDGSSVDGRAPITNDAAYGIILAAQDILNYFEGSTSPGTPDNSKAKLASVAKVEVNGQSRF